MKFFLTIIIVFSLFSCNNVTESPTLEQGKDDKNPNFQIIELVISSSYNKNGYGLNEYITTDKYGKAQYSCLITYKFSEETVNELKKFTDIYAFNSSDYGSEVSIK
jgi:hypothetical protein